jgi:YD repeat-containing protein
VVTKTRDQLTGLTTTVTPNADKNYAVPSLITPAGNANLQTSMAFSDFLGLTSVTAPNASSAGVTYDSFGRVQSRYTPFGPIGYGYDYAARKVTAGGVSVPGTITTMDGLGRAIKVETTAAGIVEAVVDTEYGPCGGCSALGKVKRGRSRIRRAVRCGRCMSTTLPDAHGW